MTKDEEKAFNKNLKFFHVIVFLFGILLVFFCVRWQIVEASKFAKIAKDRIVSNRIESIRGPIYSADGTILAFSEPRFDVYLWMDDVIFYETKGYQTRYELISKISPILGVPTTEIENKIHEFYDKQKIRWIKIANEISYSQWEKMTSLKTDKYPNLDLRGYSFIYTASRYYPEGRLATHVLGLVNKVNNSLIGVSGLERYWSEILNPTTGFVIYEQDARGGIVTSSLFPTVEPESGNAIYTNLVTRIQKIVQHHLKIGVERYKAKSGTVVIVDPKTGKVLAMANYPDYDPNLRKETDPTVYGNIAITSPYENGSTGKALTLAAVIDLNLVNPDTIMPPHEGCIEVVHDLKPICTYDRRPKGEIPVKECFATSDNVCFYRLAKMMNVRDFYNYLYAFGAGRPSGIDLHPAEESFGYLPPPEKWNLADVAAFSYGQGYQMNSVQAVMAYATIANYGVRMKPYIVNKIINSDGQEKVFVPQPIQRVLSEKSTEIVNSMMYYNYTKSIRPHEHWYAHLRNYKIGVKTGTGEIAFGGRYTDSVNSTLIGYDLSPQRAFVMLVRLEDPGVEGADLIASNNVRLIWLDIFNDIKDILGIPKMYDY
ncbi:MAG: penicillin-binding protein 2 [Candidatus Dojkabacteria bacterium]|nr:penicillin-binding protein 2 [Candidatus Dojkabacteria bacterium]